MNLRENMSNHAVHTTEGQRKQSLRQNRNAKIQKMLVTMTEKSDHKLNEIQALK